MPGPNPQPAAVPGNRWSQIEVPPLGEWAPHLSLTVVVPFYERSRELNLTIAGLSAQTYPAHLTQVVVVDDGSRHDPPRPPENTPFDLQVVTQEDLGYGLTRARNHGARVAEGEVLVFLDCDMIPERQHLEAHMRWHHAASRLVTIGFRCHAEFGSTTEAQVADAVESGNLEALAEGGRVDRPEWIEGHLRRTNDMEGPYEDLYLIMSGGNLGIERSLYLEAGGNDESFVRWGGEDNEFAYRALQRGAVVVPERAALAWHQGEGHEPDEAELESIHLQRAKLRDLIADRSMRPWIPGRQYSVPYLLVEVSPGASTVEELAVTVDSILAGDFSDLVIALRRPEDEADAIWLASTYASDPRVEVGVDLSDLVERYPAAPARLTMPAGFSLDRRTVWDLLDSLGGPGVGAIHITLPGVDPHVHMAKVLQTRAWNRVAAITNVERDALLGELFGERWVSGKSIGIRPIKTAKDGRDRLVSEAADRRMMAVPGGGAASEAAIKGELERLRSRRALRVADSIGSLFRARSMAEAKAASKALASSLTRTKTAS